jgi:hypothetical protein
MPHRARARAAKDAKAMRKVMADSRDRLTNLETTTRDRIKHSRKSIVASKKRISARKEPN